MIGRIRHGWTWFVEGVVEATLWAAARFERRRGVEVTLEGTRAVVSNAGGPPLGSLTIEDGQARFDPPEAARSLVGATVDLVVPAAWMFRRELDPVAVQSRPFLDAFVRHQIERITPWRASDVHFAVLQRPLAADANRIAVTLLVVPRRLVAPWLGPIEALVPNVLRLRPADRDATGDAVIALGAGGPVLAGSARRWVVRSLAGTALATLAVTGWLQWQTSVVQADIAEQETLLAARKAVVARAARRGGDAGDAASRLRQMRDERPLAVAVIDDLAAALPDSAHLTSLSIEGNRVTISGVSTDPSGLVPALESSGHFSDVAFGAATTRVETGGGDHFSLEMNARASVAAPTTAQATP